MKLVDVISSDLARLEKNVTLKSFFKEKPANPKSNYAVTGLYFYPAGVDGVVTFKCSR